MSRLLRLKKWLSLTEAATVLSGALNESVGSVDVLQLALDGYLVLSVNFVNRAYGRSCRSVAFEEIEWEEIPSLDGASTISVPVNGRLLFLGGGMFLVEDDVRELDGVWDLPLIGGERVDVEHLFHTLNFGPERNAVSIEGVLVKSQGGEIIEVQDRKAHRPEDRVLVPFLNPKNFHPAGALPDGCEFVVRWESIEAFIAQIGDGKKVVEKPLQPRERETLLNIIAVMLEFLQNPRPGRTSETAVIAEMIENYGEKSGIKERTLQEKFSLAKKSLAKG